MSFAPMIVSLEGAKKMRSNNKMDMTATEIIEAVKVKICDDYCKYPTIWDEETEGCELGDSEICKKCPLNQL